MAEKGYEVSEEQKIVAALRKLGVGDAPLTSETRLQEDLGLDSTHLIELTVLVHSMYGVDLGRRAAEERVLPATVADLAALMAKP